MGVEPWRSLCAQFGSWVLSGACLWAWLSSGVRWGVEKLPTALCPALALDSH